MAKYEYKPKYAVGQPVKCVMYEGLWVVDRYVQADYGVVKFIRYWIRQHDEWRGDIPEVWLEPIKIKKPVLHLVTELPLDGCTA